MCYLDNVGATVEGSRAVEICTYKLDGLLVAHVANLSKLAVHVQNIIHRRRPSLLLLGVIRWNVNTCNRIGGGFCGGIESLYLLTGNSF